MPIYLAVSPEETDRLGALQYPYAYLGYHFDSASPTLLCPQMEVAPSSLMVLQDQVLPQYAPTEALAQCVAQYAATIHSGIFCDFDQPFSKFWSELLQNLDQICPQVGLSLWVPERYAEAAPHACVVVGSDLSGGFFSPHMQERAQEYPGRAVLELRPISTTFRLPCPTGEGEPLTPQTRDALRISHGTSVFTSSELLCSYFSFWEADALHMTLFDTVSSIRKKLAAAEDAGFCAAIGLLQELKCMLDESGS